MNDKTVIREDLALLTKCKRIFGGNLVLKAYITTYDYGNSSVEEIQQRLDADSFIDDGKDELQYDTCEILVEFCNGKKVMFQASEWAIFYNLKDEVYSV